MKGMEDVLLVMYMYLMHERYVCSPTLSPLVPYVYYITLPSTLHCPCIYLLSTTTALRTVSCMVMHLGAYRQHYA